MIHFETGEPVNINNCVVKVGGDFNELDLVSVCKWNTDEVYTQVQAYFLKYGSWFDVNS